MFNSPLPDEFDQMLPLRPKVAPFCGSRVVHKLIYGNLEQIFWTKTTRHKALTLSSEPLTNLFKLCPWGPNWPCGGGHLFYLDLYKAKVKVLYPVNFVIIIHIKS